MAERIIIGEDINNPLYTFDNATIRDCVCVLSSSMVGDQLAIDQFMPVVYSAEYIRAKFVPKGSNSFVTADGKTYMVYTTLDFLDKLAYGTPIRYYSGDALMGKFYSQRITRTAKAFFDIVAVSAIGVLDGQEHRGGLYTGQTFRAVATEIIGDQFAFSCAEDVANIQVFGWLPIGTRRSNLHQLLFACGVSLGKDSAGDMYFKFPDAETYKDIPKSRIFLGGNIDYMTPATTANVTEHAWLAIATDQTVTLFDNTDGSGEANNAFVKFDAAPVRDLAATGTLEIVESGVNYAIVTGTGTLTGRPYTHTTKVISKSVDNVGGAENAVSVPDATLVSIANSENVAKRVLSYYSAARTIASDIILGDEKPGDLVSFTNPYDDPEVAFLASMEINASSFLRASCEMVTGYVPVGQGNNFSRVIILTGSGTWVSPGGKARITLIGGGSGGASGGNGASHDAYDPGEGGVAGVAGAAGKLLVKNIDTIKGDKFAYNCGEAGIGGVPDDTEKSIPGTAGMETTFGDFSTADGVVSVHGCVDLFTGEIYGLPGADGIPGSAGASNDNENPTVVYDGKTYFPGARGADSGSAKGGYGGGPAAGANGEDGGNARRYVWDDDVDLVGGRGGNGATPVDGRNAKTYGSGGEGGHGGGGSGQKGGPYDGWLHGGAGVGGKGSKGGNGMPGCIVIYLEV